MSNDDRGCTIDVEDDCNVGYINLGECITNQLFSIVGSGTLNLIGPGPGVGYPLFDSRGMVLYINGPTIIINLTENDLAGLMGSQLNLITGNLIIDCSQANEGSSLILATTSGPPVLDISDSFGKLFLNDYNSPYGMAILCIGMTLPKSMSRRKFWLK